MRLAAVSFDTPLVWTVQDQRWPARRVPGSGLLLRILSLAPPELSVGPAGVVQWTTPDDLRQQAVRVRHVWPTAWEVAPVGRMMAINSRAVPRLRLTVPLAVGLTQPDWPTYSTDLSLFGASFRSPIHLRVGDAIHMRLDLATGSVRLEAAVVRVVPDAAGWRVAVRWPADDAGQYDLLRAAMAQALAAAGASPRGGFT